MPVSFTAAGTRNAEASVDIGGGRTCCSVALRKDDALLGVID